MFLILPTQVDMHFPYALQHVVLPYNYTGDRNLGPESADVCSTLQWTVKGGLQVQPELTTRRCRTFLSVPVGDTTILSSPASCSGTCIEMRIPRANDTQGDSLLLTLAPAQGLPGAQAVHTTHVFRPRTSSSLASDASSQASLSIKPAVNFAAFEPIFRDLLSDTACPLAPGGAKLCNSSYAGHIALWDIRCLNQAQALQAWGNMSNKVTDVVDLQVAAQQTVAGFAAGLHVADRSLSESEKALWESTAGANNVVAQVSAPRVNLLSALIIAAIATIVYQVAVFNDKASAEVALDCIKKHTSANGSAGGDMTEADARATVMLPGAHHCVNGGAVQRYATESAVPQRQESSTAHLLPMPPQALPGQPDSLAAI